MKFSWEIHSALELAGDTTSGLGADSLEFVTEETEVAEKESALSKAAAFRLVFSCTPSLPLGAS